MTATILSRQGHEAEANVQTYFNELSSWANHQLEGDEVLTLYLAAEDSNFVRFNRNLVRQAGSVQQRSLSVDLIEGARHATGSVQLSQDPAMDRAQLGNLLRSLREQRRVVPEDPYLAVSTDGASIEEITVPDGPGSDEVIDEIQIVSEGKDLVGIYADGSLYHGFASSLGQRNWYQTSTFNFDWSFYLHADKAVKNAYAGQRWDGHVFRTKVEVASQQLGVLGRTPIDLAPGGYRTYLTPSAMEELMTWLSYYSFGLKAYRTRQTPLLKLATGDEALHPSVHLTEDTAGGTGPNFQEQGFLRPDRVKLIGDGHLTDHLVSPRSAREYGVETNGASTSESPESLALAPGTLSTDRVLEELGTGLHIGNLWYLNYSDRAGCRTTGMTRFATFWVEGGEIVAPVNVMRFDDTVYNILGRNLVGLSDRADTILDPSTYVARSSSSLTLPGALVEDLRFTL